VRRDRVVHRIGGSHARGAGDRRSRSDRLGRWVAFRLGQRVPALGAEQGPRGPRLTAMEAYGHTGGKVNSVYLRLVRW
jgi:hypothetical protein